MRLLGVDIPDNKKLAVALTYIYGIGPTLALSSLSATGVNPDKRAKELTPEEVARLQKFIDEKCEVEGELRQKIKQNIARLKDIGSYRGGRHSRRLPLRGQRTRRNTRTIRGNVRRTVGSGRRKVELK